MIMIGSQETNYVMFGHAQVCATHRRETLRAPSADLAKNRSQSTNLVDLGTSNGSGTHLVNSSGAELEKQNHTQECSCSK